MRIGKSKVLENICEKWPNDFSFKFQVFIHSSDTDGRALLGRFQTKTQDLQSDDQEVKVQVYINQIFYSMTPFPAFVHWTHRLVVPRSRTGDVLAVVQLVGLGSVFRIFY